MKEEVLKKIEEEIEQVVVFHTSDLDIKKWDTKEIWQVVNTIFTAAPQVQGELEKLAQGAAGKFDVIKIRDAMANLLAGLMREEYDKMERMMGEQSGKPDFLRDVERGLSLRVIDSLWIEHLEEIDYLRTGIGLRGYAGHDPLVEYKKETYRMWNELQAAINKQLVYSIFKIEAAQRIAPAFIRDSGRQGIKFSGADKGGEEPSPQQPKNKVGRNDPCPCKSGKKFKRCHGR